MRRCLGCLGVLSACSSPAPAPAAAMIDGAVDSAIDADPCALPYALTPVTVSGSAPPGTLDSFRYAFAGHTICPEAYLITFSTNELDPNCGPLIFELDIYPPYSTTGANAAGAQVTVEPRALTTVTDKVTFEATQLDPPDAAPPHIIGHFTSQDPLWTFDIAIDLISQFDSYVCI